jgi:branched-chain amino acid transport system substrate-binding protein
MVMKNLIAVSVVSVLAGWSGAATAQQADAAASDAEISIGNVMPYTGELAAFASIGRTEAAYFDMINEQGGVNGRKIRFLTYNDNSDPEMASAQLHKLADEDKVLLMFGSFGLTGNRAIKTYLNQQKIPQLFIASGDDEWSNPKGFPWTMG